MRTRRTTSKGYELARALRREMTPAERRLWSMLRGNQVNGVSFRRQHAVGPFIVDFCALKEKLILELDGGQHLEQADYDQERTRYLESQGYRVMRFWNNEVMNDLDGVVRAIMNALEDNHSGIP